ncbi:MAG TPA: hypothetical protein VKB88_30105 [Bryobacteraceae bacterium]|nr:hypothetical protein [Bryobacteraceae bacterium]
MKQIIVLLAVWATGAAGADVGEIMSRVGENQTRAQQLRREYTFHQQQLLRMMRGNNRLAREERREYDVVPGSDHVTKSLIRFDGRYEQHGKYIAYDHPGYEYRDMDIDGNLINELSEDMTNDGKSRDGLGCDLFPLTSREQRKYDFQLMGVETRHGREVYRLSFQPKPHNDEGDWKGEALIDTAEYQPLEVHTSLAAKIPLFVKVVLGTNIKGLGFSVSYRRFEDGVWFPVSYGGEFEVRAVFFYMRKISLSMVNDNFRRTHVETSVKYATMER